MSQRQLRVTVSFTADVDDNVDTPTFEGILEGVLEHSTAREAIYEGVGLLLIEMGEMRVLAKDATDWGE